MILTGKNIVESKIVENLLDENLQIQPCGIDFTLKKVIIWNSEGVIDFDNTQRKLPEYKELEFQNNKIILPKGAYLLEFNETVTMPLNVMAFIQTRSSVFRSGAILTAGVVDPGYKGAIGAMLQICNDSGITLIKNAKLAQWVFMELKENAHKGYNGVYQNAKSII